jgi:hypothetical protein
VTRDDIIRMAREVIPNSAAFELKGHYEIERFAALVAAYEREACAQEVFDYPTATFSSLHLKQGIARAIRARGEHDKG